jgi:hypothetical protein
MSPPIPSVPVRRYRPRGSRNIGKAWLVVLFLVFTSVHYTGLFALPFLGNYAKTYEAALFVATIWTTVLLAAIWARQSWARVTLALFLLCFVATQLVFIPDVIVHSPEFRDSGLRIVLLLAATDFLAALFLITSPDIRQISDASIN